MISLTVIVAALNEEANLAAAIEAIRRAYDPLRIPYEILIFDDHSTDRTGDVADALARGRPDTFVVHNAERLNIGGIYKAGIERARHAYCILLPGDNEVDVAQVAEGVQYLGQADVVLSYPDDQRSRPRLRRCLSWVYTRMVNLLFGTEFSYTNGSSYIRTALLREQTIRTNGFSYQTETLMKLVRQGVDFIEFGIRVRYRQGGRSTALKLHNWWRVVSAIGRLWWEVFVTDRGRYRRVGLRVTHVSPSRARPRPSYEGRGV
jgi:glycosyltransferase involved in cell wall biosynthesis